MWDARRSRMEGMEDTLIVPGATRLIMYIYDPMNTEKELVLINLHIKMSIVGRVALKKRFRDY